jgi:hypothetical protein
MDKPKTIQDILPEAVIIREFCLPVPKSGRSRVISSWIGQGLKYFEISEARYVLKEDLLNFFWQKYQECQEG